MKKLAIVFSSFALVSLIGTAQASSIQYQYTATHAREFYNDMSLAAASDYLFADGIAITTTFIFDNSVAAVATNQVHSGDLRPYGLYSYYEDSISNLRGQLEGHVFGADTGGTVVGNSNLGDLTFGDGVFNMVGNREGADIGAGFTGFNVGDFSLKAVTAYSVSGWNYLSDQSLPETLTTVSAPYGNTGVNLVFEDSNHSRRTVAFWGGTVAQIATVPEPASIWLLGAGLAGVVGFNRRLRSL